MECKHERLKTIGDRLFCCECEAELPLEFLVVNNGENRPKKAAPGEKTDKPATRKRTAKKAV